MYVACPQCDVLRRWASDDKAQDIADDHNEQMHDGEKFAIVEPVEEDALDRMEKHAREVANGEQKRKFLRTLVREQQNKW